MVGRQSRAPCTGSGFDARCSRASSGRCLSLGARNWKPGGTSRFAFLLSHQTCFQNYKSTRSKRQETENVCSQQRTLKWAGTSNWTMLRSAFEGQQYPNVASGDAQRRQYRSKQRARAIVFASGGLFALVRTVICLCTAKAEGIEETESFFKAKNQDRYSCHRSLI